MLRLLAAGSLSLQKCQAMQIMCHEKKWNSEFRPRASLACMVKEERVNVNSQQQNK